MKVLNRFLGVQIDRDRVAAHGDKLTRRSDDEHDLANLSAVIYSWDGDEIGGIHNREDAGILHQCVCDRVIGEKPPLA